MCVFANVSRIQTPDSCNILLRQPKLLCDFKLPKTTKNDTMNESRCCQVTESFCGALVTTSGEDFSSFS